MRVEQKSKLEVFFEYTHKNNGRQMATIYSVEALISAGKVALPLLVFSLLENLQKKEQPSFASLVTITSFFLLNTFLPRIRDLMVSSVRFGVQTDLTVDMVQSVYNRELDTLLGAPTGSCAVITSKNYGTVGDVIPTFFSGILPIFFETLATTLLLSQRYGAVGLSPMFTLGVYFLVAFLGEKKSAAFKEESSKYKISGFGALLSSIHNYQMAHQYGNTTHELGKLRSELSKLEEAHKTEQRATEKTSLFLSVINQLAFAATIVYALYSFPQSFLSADFALLSYYLVKFSSAIESLPAKINTFYTGFGDADLVVGFLNAESKVPDPKHPKNFQLKSPPTLEFKNVNFSYDSKGQSKEGLSDISFVVKPNQKVVIMGATGSGKSTLLKLIQRFYDFEGQILIDGVDTKTIRKKDLRTCLSVVSQETGLMDDTIYNNITYSDLSASEDDVVKAAKFAGLKFEKERLFSKVQQQGMNFSGGEKQRVSIARALLKPNAQVFLLDEPTSSLDQETSKEVIGVLDQLCPVATTLVVTHDPNVAANADFILYMDKGKIVEQGTFAQLMKAQGAFYNQVLVQCQKLGIGVETIQPLEKRDDSDSSFAGWRQSRNFSM